MADDLDHTREHPDPDEGRWADSFLLDRHRIVHAMAFRRLQYKTQVFLPFEADHFRNRMTHTLEVAQTGMALAERLGGDRMVTELICLAHDLGHGPFGHAGERALDAVMADFGGFEHNDQSLRVVTYLERPYPYFSGLNLTRAVRAGLRSHGGRHDRPGRPRSGGRESDLAGWADRLAYDAGDLEDAIGAGLVSVQSLAGLDLWRRAVDRLAKPFRDRPIHAVRRVICEAIQHVVAEGLTVHAGGAVHLGSETTKDLTEFEEFLLNNVYRHRDVSENDQACNQIITRLFDACRHRPQLMPQRFLRRRQVDRLERIVGDYISGMTDRFCLKTYRQVFGDDDMLLALLKTTPSPGSW